MSSELYINNATKIVLLNGLKKVIDWEKIEKLPTVNDMLDEMYGKKGTPTRNDFMKEAYAYYNQVISEPDDKDEDYPICESKQQTETVRENVLVSEEN